MQPHSQCAVALAGFIWNNRSDEKVVGADFKVWWQDLSGQYNQHVYNMKFISESDDKLSFSVMTQRDGGGTDPCTIQLWRKSPEEGSLITMYHQTNHVSGLREEFNLYRLAVSNGMHYNSQKYRAFHGGFRTDNWKDLDLISEIKRSDDTFAEVRYQIERTNINLKR